MDYDALGIVDHGSDVWGGEGNVGSRHNLEDQFLFQVHMSRSSRFHASNYSRHAYCSTDGDGATAHHAIPVGKYRHLCNLGRGVGEGDAVVIVDHDADASGEDGGVGTGNRRAWLRSVG